MKRCSHCKEFKPFSDFTKSKQRLKYDGLALWCKPCKKLYDLSKTDRHHNSQTLPEALYRFFTPGKPGQCWLWESGTGKNGYGYIRFQNKDYLAHRVAWSIHRGAIPSGFFVCHHCDVRSCLNYVDHLFLGTNADNIKDAAIKGRLSTKLNVPDDIHLIRQLLPTTPQTEIARQFNVTKYLIWRIKNNLCYKHIS